MNTSARKYLAAIGRRGGKAGKGARFPVCKIGGGPLSPRIHQISDLRRRGWTWPEIRHLLGALERELAQAAAELGLPGEAVARVESGANLTADQMRPIRHALHRIRRDEN